MSGRCGSNILLYQGTPARACARCVRARPCPLTHRARQGSKSWPTAASTEREWHTSVCGAIRRVRRCVYAACRFLNRVPPPPPPPPSKPSAPPPLLPARSLQLSAVVGIFATAASLPPSPSLSPPLSLALPSSLPPPPPFSTWLRRRGICRRHRFRRPRHCRPRCHRRTHRHHGPRHHYAHAAAVSPVDSSCRRHRFSRTQLRRGPR